MPLKIDLHCHSFFSGDGVSSPEQLIEAARKKGLNGFVITDHNTCDAITYMLDAGLMRKNGLPVNDFLVVPLAIAERQPSDCVGCPDFRC